MKKFNDSIAAKKNIKWGILLAILALAIEALYFAYNIVIEKVYTKYHFIGNQPIEVKAEELVLDRVEEDYEYYKVDQEFNEKIYNVLLICKEEHPNNVYIRSKIDTSEDVIFKSNPEGTEFNSYYIGGADTKNLTVIIQNNQLKIDDIDKVIINSNVQFVNKASISLIRILIFYSIALVIYFIVIYYKKIIEKINEIKFEKLILITLIVFGLIFTFMNTPLDVYDEHGHFWRAYELSLGHLKSNPDHRFPKSVVNILFKDDGTYPNRDFDYANLIDKLKIPLNPEEQMKFAVGATSSYTIINYFPSVVGVFIARILELNPMIIFYVGRLFNLAAYIVIVYLAIKIMPVKRFKYILGLISVFPMCINLAASYSPDAIIISFAMLAISYILKLKFDPDIDKITWKQMAMFAVIALIPTICKIVYVFLFGLIFLIPKEKFKSKSSRIIYCALEIIVALIGYYIFCVMLKGKGEITIEKNSIEQISYCLANPFTALEIFSNTLIKYTDNYIVEMVGGWNTPEAISYIVFVMLMIITFYSQKDEEYKLEKSDRILLIIMSILEILAVFLAMWVVWSTAKQTYIMGVQGRYFLPTLPLLLIGINSNLVNINVKNKKSICAIIMVIAFAFCIYSSIYKFI